MERKVKRVILVGLDGMQLCQVKQFAREGGLTNFSKLLSRGSCGDLLPEWPAWTPTNWGTMATGALPGTTMLGGWLRRGDDDLEGRWDVSTFSSRACPTETIWEAAERAGLSTLTIFHPISWPPVVKEGMVVAPLYSGPGIKPLGISSGRIWKSRTDGTPRGIPILVSREGEYYTAKAGISPTQTGVAREFNFGDKPDLTGEKAAPGKAIDLLLKFNPAEQRIFDIFINLKGRYPKGIVEPGDYEGVQNQIIDALLDWRNPAGERVVAFALKKQDAQIVGYWGKEAGDVFFVFNAGHGRSNLPEGTSVIVARGGANHGPQISTTSTRFSSDLSSMVIGGPGIRKNYERDHDSVGLWRLTDVVPTISYLLGFDPPAHSRGAVMHDLFGGG